MKLTIVRGLPGSGADSLASKLAEKSECLLIGSDMFFEDIEVNYKLFKASCQYAFGQTFYELIRGGDVVVYGTFDQKWMLGDYITSAEALGAEWDIIEPNTKHKYDPIVCAEKSGNTVAYLQKIKDKWESTKDIIKFFRKNQSE